MFVLKCTQKLLKDMKVPPSEIHITSPLSSWHVNMYKLRNRKLIIFVNDYSRLCLIISGIRSAQPAKLFETFRTELRSYMLAEEIEEHVVNTYLSSADEIWITKTDSRSVLGTMNEMMIYTEVSYNKSETNEERLRWLNRSIYSPIDYKEPIHVFKEALQQAYS
ncbi:hypothetical protein SY83_14560 [Paenibacillus swuensis]|uniref:DUF6933 domain-containing protein n=1 Tax=Paenibacillus swuensis TaxID=1178515 RepID=A0A172TJY6_9BACL|nr:hypothetical protein SY83_14560 [Paenibacillus swuensis]